MTRMHAVNRVIVRAIICLSALIAFTSTSAFAASSQENLYVFVFKDGVAQSNIRVQAGENSALTNSYGAASFSLKEGDYEVGYYQQNETQDESLFALTEVAIQGSVSSQVFLTLTKDGANVDLDLPLSEYSQDFEVQQLKKQEGPKGELSLTVLDSVSNEPVKEARLFFRGYAIDASTNEQGLATVALSQGTYDISVVHPNYVLQIRKEIGVTANQTTFENMSLVKADIVLDEFVVNAPFVEGSLASNIAALKEADVVSDAISSEQFKKSGDSDAAGALKRVTGITVVDGKYVYVRGLGERYSAVLLNGLEVPSTEPTKRVVPLDIFPASVIESMDIQKTYSSDLPGTFGGGTIQINTKDIPKEDNYVAGSISISVNDYTGDEVIYQPDNRTELPSLLIEKSDGFQELADEVRVGNTILVPGLTPAERLALDRAMVNYRDYGLETTKLKPGSTIDLSAGQSFKTSGGIQYGFAGNIYYKSKQLSSGEVIEDDYQIVNGAQAIDTASTSERTTLNEKFGGLVSLGLEPHLGQKIKYTLLGLVEEEDQTKLKKSDDFVEASYSEKTLLRYTEQEMLSHQLNGTHVLDIWSKPEYAMELDWGYSTSTATRLEPGTFEYVYKDSASGSGLVIDKNKMFYQYSDLEDTVDNYRLDLGIPFSLLDRSTELDIGFYQLNKERSLDNRRFKFGYQPVAEDAREIDEILSQANADTTSLNITSNYRQDDAYTAEQDLSAIYANWLVAVSEKLDVFFGARQEDSTQELVVGIQPTALQTYALETSDVLPFLGLTYRMSDEHQFRFGVSETLSRPDFREFSPTRYKDPQTDYIVRGNPDLKYTTISNFDFKYEWFPSYDETISLGVFSKQFTNPIESVRSRPDEDIEITYANAESADSIGLEFGFRQNLEKLYTGLENYFVEGNYTYIESEVSLSAADVASNGLTSTSRPMQGQSPYVVNLKLGYDNFFTRRSAMFLYNVYGERITALGINGTPDVYEQPFHSLDFVVKWGLNDTYDDQEKRIGYGVSLKLKNLLDSEIEKLQGGETVELRKPGREIELGFSIKY